MPHDAGPVRLTDSQRRHYEVLLARLERTLVHLETAARGDDGHTEMTVVEADLSPSFLAESPDAIATARAQLTEIARSLSLRPRVESRRRVCRALITSELNGLTDATSKRLRGFGDVDPSVGEHLDPKLEALRASVARLADLLA